MAETANQRVRLTKQLLKRSLMELMETENISKISIKSICQRAGINRSTFYKYYGSQFDLLQEIEQETVQDVVSLLESHPGKKADALLEICRYMDQNARFFRLLIAEDSGLVSMILSHPAIRQEIGQAIPADPHQAQGAYLFEFIIYGTARIIQLWLRKDRRESPEEIAQLLAGLMRVT